MARKRRRLGDQDSARPYQGDVLISGNSNALHIAAYPVLVLLIIGSLAIALYALSNGLCTGFVGVLLGLMFAGLFSVILFEHYRRQSYRIILCEDCIQWIKFGNRVTGQIPLDNIENVFVAMNDGQDMLAGEEDTDVVAIKLIDRRAEDTFWADFCWRKKKKYDLIIYSEDNYQASKMCKLITEAVRANR